MIPLQMSRPYTQGGPRLCLWLMWLRVLSECVWVFCVIVSFGKKLRVRGGKASEAGRLEGGVDKDATYTQICS